MMQGKILDFLRRKSDYISGEELSHRLGVTRQALWKHIQELKDKGYDIVAIPHLGYRLVSAPDRLFPAELAYNLNTKFMGKKIYYFDAVSSTMDIAMELGLKGCPCGTLVLAETQVKGRGRLGRAWFSPKYKGIYLSLILRPKIPPLQAPILTLVSAVGICEAIKETVGLEPQIKWPNDICLRHKKVGGILTELNAEMDEVRFMVIGIGINVNNEKKNLYAGATSLKEQKKEDVGRCDFLRHILSNIEKNYLRFAEEGSPPILEKWRDYSITLGKRVKIYSRGQHLEGVALDIDIDGSLLVRKDSGLTQKVAAGDVVHCR